jgi:hypothetical protein
LPPKLFEQRMQTNGEWLAESLVVDEMAAGPSLPTRFRLVGLLDNNPATIATAGLTGWRGA